MFIGALGGTYVHWSSGGDLCFIGALGGPMFIGALGGPRILGGPDVFGGT